MKLLEHFKELSVHPNNTDDLKGFILELALRGTLTKGFNLNRIPAKDRVDGFYEVPSDWYWDKFDDLCEFNMGKTPPSKSHEYWGGEHPWISIADMSTYATVSDTKKTLSDKGLNDYFKDGLVKAGTLIMSFKLTIGKTSILGVDSCHNEAIISIYPNERILKDYLFLFLPIISNWGTQVNALMGNTLNKGKIQNLKVPVPPLEEQKAIVEVVKQLITEVEQLESLTKERVQLKESFVVSALNKLTEAENTQQEWNFLQQHFSSFFTEKKNIKSLRETILQLAVQGKLTALWRANNSNSEPASELLKRIEAEKKQLIAEKKIRKEKPLSPVQDEEIPFDLPKKWIWCRLGETASSYKRDIIDGPFGSNLTATEYVESGVPIIRLQNISRNKFLHKSIKYITEEKAEFLKRHNYDHGDVVICKLGDPTGKACIIPKEMQPGRIVADIVRYRVNDSILFNEYLCFALNAPLSINQFNSEATGMTRQRVNLSKMRELLFALPPREEQQAIVEKVNSLMALCDELELQIETSQTQIDQLMQSCLQEVFQHESN